MAGAISQVQNNAIGSNDIGRISSEKKGRATDGQTVTAKTSDSSKLANLAEEITMFVRDFKFKKKEVKDRKLSRGKGKGGKKPQKVQKAQKIDTLLAKTKNGKKLSPEDIKFLQEFIKDSQEKLGEHGRKALALLEEYVKDLPDDNEQAVKEVNDLKAAFKGSDISAKQAGAIAKIFSKFSQGGIQDFKTPRQAMKVLMSMYRNNKLAEAISDAQKRLGSELGQMNSSALKTEPVRFQVAIQDVYTLKVLVGLMEDCQSAEDAMNRKIAKMGGVVND